MNEAVVTAKPKVFPASAVEAALRSELIDAAKADAAVTGPILPTSSTEIVKAPARIDSLIAVTIVCAIEPIVGMKLSENMVRAGGYSSINSALEHLMSQVEKAWNQRQGVKS